MKLEIRGEIYKVKSIVKKVENFTLVTMYRHGLLWALTLHEDHYRLYPPLGQISLCFSDCPLSDIRLILNSDEQRPAVFSDFPIKEGGK